MSIKGFVTSPIHTVSSGFISGFIKIYEAFLSSFGPTADEACNRHQTLGFKDRSQDSGLSDFGFPNPKYLQTVPRKSVKRHPLCFF